MSEFPNNAVAIEDAAWWVRPFPKYKRPRGRPRTAMKKYPLSQEAKDTAEEERLKRAALMVSKFKSGMTLEEIGKEFNLTRERVRQILKKSGIDKLEGGQAIRCLLSIPDRIQKEKERIEKKEAFKRKTWGISLNEWTMLREEFGYKPFRAFNNQRMNARKRGIGWELDFKTWWSIWQDSGHWEERGRGEGYCMARHGDSGPYSKENVYICTVGQNFSDSYIAKPAHTRKRVPGFAASTHCRRGHLRTPESTYVYKGQKSCRICRDISSKKYRTAA